MNENEEKDIDMKIEKVCVYCASSQQANPVYRDAARHLGEILADNSITTVYGGGAVGSMGALADGAISKGGRVIGIIPRFMVEMEWANGKISDLIVVNDMAERKKKMIEGVDAVIALPGGTGTLEELIEAITWKRLGLYLNPIILMNTLRFFDHGIELLNKCVSEKFMDEKHKNMWTVVNEPEDVLQAIRLAPKWYKDARHFAAI